MAKLERVAVGSVSVRECVYVCVHTHTPGRGEVKHLWRAAVLLSRKQQA